VRSPKRCERGIGFFWSEAAGEVLGALFVEVCGDLAGEIAVAVVTAEKRSRLMVCHLYSVRRACAGSSWLARHAGMMQAHAAVMARTRTTALKTLQSKGLMP
jgi:hypothetical protein